MNWGTVLTSVAFRAQIAYVFALSVAVFLVMVFIYAIFTYTYFQDLQSSINDELETLDLVYEGQGVAGVDQYIVDQRSANEGPRFHYLLAGPGFEKVAGTLEQWPEYREFGDGWVSFGLDFAELGVGRGDMGIDLFARNSQLADGLRVLVALRYSDIMESNQLVMNTLLRTMFATLVLGVVGGYISAAVTLRRIDSINEGINAIVQGDLSQRIPLGDAIGNVRELIENFNHMLDQTESLMQGVRTVSDNIAHDLRTPLTRMRNKLSQLQTAVGAEQEEPVQEIIDECDEILTTFNALLRIAQLEAGNRKANFVDVDLGALVHDVVELYEPLAQEKNISLGTHCEHLQYHGDRDLIFQMVVNLLDNAVKYTPDNGDISVTVKHAGDGSVLVSLADSGPGIPLADRENVFRRFFRLESSRGQQPGSGLGLSLVQAVVNLHRGAIALRDNRPGLRVDVALG